MTRTTTTKTRKRKTSPYFDDDKNEYSPSSSTQGRLCCRSRYFGNDESSVHASIQSFGPYGRVLDHPNDQNQETITNGKSDRQQQQQECSTRSKTVTKEEDTDDDSTASPSSSSRTNNAVVSRDQDKPNGSLQQQQQQWNQPRVATALLKHFAPCPEFQRQWSWCTRQAKSSGSIDHDHDHDYDDAVSLEQSSLHRAVRHLCPHLCYMKAFAPLREWHKVRQQLTAGSDDGLRSGNRGVDEILAGWRCALRSSSRGGNSSSHHNNNNNNSAPRVDFISPDGLVVVGAGTAAKTIRAAAHKKKKKKTTDRQRRVTTRRLLLLLPDKHDVTTRQPTLQGLDDKNVDLSWSSLLLQQQQPWESPLGLLEELFAQRPWQLLLSTIFLNRTRRTQVDAILYQFLQQWPTPQAVLQRQRQANGVPNQKTEDNSANDDEDDDDMATLLRPLGLHRKRAAGIVQFTQDYVNKVKEYQSKYGDAAPFHFARDDVLRFYNCGEYAYSAYRMFIQRKFDDIRTSDHALLAYADYHHHQQQQQQQQKGGGGDGIFARRIACG